LGNVEAREIGPRSRVWSEPEMVQAGAFEFSETEDFLAAAEVRRCRLTL
jgi:leukotriene-A4 hydrolase